MQSQCNNLANKDIRAGDGGVERYCSRSAVGVRYTRRRLSEAPMTAFTMQVHQNPYLAQGAAEVHAILSVAADGAATAGRKGKLAEAFLIDCSGSMDGEKARSAKDAVERAVDLLSDDAWFCVIAGNEGSTVVFSLAPATPANKHAAHAAIRKLKAGGGTAMSTWLEAARAEFARRPDLIHHALLLTDGKNEGEEDADLARSLRNCEGHFQCDARGVGTDWVPDQLRMISSKLLGTLDIIPRPADIEADFRKVIEAALGKSVADVTLRLWSPVGATVDFCRQVYPEKLELTHRAKVDPKTGQVRDYPTGAWGAEKRDYHICVRVKPGQLGQRMLAGRASLLTTENGQEAKVAEGMMLGVWTDDEAQSAVIHPEVAHYTGQAELADAIQAGLKARAAGNEPEATRLLGRAVQLAAETNPETMKLLRKVVQVEDERLGTVKLLKGVRKEDEFALDTRSMRTSRVSKGL